MHTRNILLISLLVPILAGAAGHAPEKVDDDWLSNVQQQIAEGEYHVTWQARTYLPDLDAAWHAPNRSHNLRIYFTGDGIRVVPRTASESSWEWSLSLTGYGRSDEVSPVEEAMLLPDENRIDYNRESIIEWYVNDRTGLKQGFTLAEPPESIEESEQLPAYLVLQLGGTLSPVISTDGQAIDFAAPGGAKVLHYAELMVTDAMGRELPAWMEGFAESGVRGIRIVFDDSEAVYPVTVDPLATSPAWTADGRQSGAHFGVSVSTAGDVNGDGYSDVIVGAPSYDDHQVDAGRAFVFYGGPEGLGNSAEWTADGDQDNASFGVAVSTAGDVNGDGYSDVVIGADMFDNYWMNEGRVFVYHGSETGLALTADWTAESTQVDSRFGHSVSTAGDVNGDGYGDVIVGAYNHDNGQVNEGQAYVYLGSPAGLFSTAAWTGESNQSGAQFGISVSTAGDVNGDGYGDVIVGCDLFDAGHTDEGIAYVYYGSMSGLTATPSWIGESDQDGAQFGIAVSTAGDVNGDGYADVIVGASFYNGGGTDDGRVYVFRGSETGLSATADWIANGNQSGAEFGTSVSTVGDVNGDGYADVIVGARYYDSTGINEGRAFVYHGSATGLSEDFDWTEQSDLDDAYFGSSVAAAGDVNGDGFSDVIVGASHYTDGEINEGRAYAYHGSAAGLLASPAWTAESNQAGACFGYSVSTAGDVNGDGYADVIIGSHNYDNGDTDEGRAFVYCGSAIGLPTAADWIAESNQADAGFGYSVSTAGDVNDDGYSDVIIGAFQYTNGETEEGRVYVYHGSAAGLNGAPDWTAESDHAYENFGYAVSTAGDVNGDGYSDVLIGVYSYTNGETNEGRAYVYHGSSAGLSATAEWTAEGDREFAYFGVALSTAGDVNGDGYSEVIVGAPFHRDLQGRAYVYEGSAAGLSATAYWSEGGSQNGALFGWSVSTAGDVNGDGYADIIVGAQGYDNDETNEGRAYVFYGDDDRISTDEAWITEGNQADAYFGESVSTAGDVNGDGFADVIVGARGYDNGEIDEGWAFVYHGSEAGLSTIPDWTAESDQIGAGFGGSASTAGDVNGDGYADIIVGADSYDNGEMDEGMAFVYYGGGGPGLSLVPQQWQAVDDVPIGHIGSSDSFDEFRVRLRGRSPFGGGRAKLEWEVKPLEEIFYGEDTRMSASWTEFAGGAVQFSELVTGLEDGVSYHWRVRLRYDGASTPYQQFSRWVTVPWNGWNEADLRTLADLDDDGYSARVDCDDIDPDLWSVPGEAVSLLVAADKQTFYWDPPLVTGGVPGTVAYDLLRSPLPDDFVAMALCIATDIATTSAVDVTTPGTGELLSYLARAENHCGLGSLGQNSDAVERTGRTCP